MAESIEAVKNRFGIVGKNNELNEAIRAGAAETRNEKLPERRKIGALRQGVRDADLLAENGGPFP